MYSPLIVHQNIRKAVKLGLEIKRRSVDERIGVAEALALISDNKGNLKRALTEQEKGFIASEQVLCRLDFRYFAEAYGVIELDASEGGGIAPIKKLWQSQEIALKLLAKREEEAHEQYKKEGFSEGILSCYNKARQQGVTALWRLLLWHRCLFYKRTRSLSATIGSPNDKNKLELYNRDKIILDNLPWFLQVPIKFDVKGEQLELDEPIRSRMAYADDTQKAGIGTGTQIDCHHMTEVGLWNMAERLEYDFLPGVPKSPLVLGGWESTANGRQNFWHIFTENVRHKKRGYEHWIYTFIPWYLIGTKYRRVAPDDWTPDDNTVQHAEMVEKTSHEWNGGQTYRLSRHQMYWWESEYIRAQQQGQLGVFFSNYPATPEESFQHFSGAAFSYETLEFMRQTSAINGCPYFVHY